VRVWYQCGGEVAGKAVGGWMWGKKCIHIYVNEKMIPVETIPGIRGEGDKGEQWRGEFKYDIFDTL
jgi:hypothetical protein